MKAYLDKYNSRYNRKNIFAYGGSHGGFLSAWLSVHPEYTKLFNSAVILNPVIDIYSLYTSSDIPDWAYELTSLKELNFAVSDEEMINMKTKSPISYVKNCETSILLLIGGDDKRVTPQNNGIHFYHCLKHHNKDVKMKYYPTDEHSLASPETSIDVLYSMIEFINEKRKE